MRSSIVDADKKIGHENKKRPSLPDNFVHALRKFIIAVMEYAALG